MPAITPVSSGTHDLRDRTAANLRAELARRQMTHAHLARLIGVSRGWVSMRTTGLIPMDVDDIEAIAYVLMIRPEKLLRADEPPAARRGLKVLPRQDSNLEPAGYGMQPQVGHAA